MMNDIKFRAWDKKNKKFLKPYREQHIGNWVNKLSINMDGSLSFHEDDGFGGKIIGGESIEKRFEIMQYTGLKDKNGTEIYEGDIVQGGIMRATGGIEIYNSSTTVHFKSGMFKCGGVSLNSYSNKVEVIGNIYENPELLGDNK